MYGNFNIRSSKSIGLLLLAGFLIFSFVQFGNARDMESEIMIKPTEDFLHLMNDEPQMAGERLEEEVLIVNKSERPVPVRLFAAAVVGGEIHHKYLSDKEVTIKPGGNVSLASPSEDFLPNFRWVSGMNWVPTSTWVPNPEMYSAGFYAGAKGNNPFLEEDLQEALVSSDRAAHMLYLVALPTGDLGESITTSSLVIGGPNSRILGNQWVPVDKRK
jgi:hypothetical protein